MGAEPGNPFEVGKFVPAIAMAHEIPYVATASIHDLHDLEHKVEKAMALRGARYLEVFVTCPLGWGSTPANTLKVARLAVTTGCVVVNELEDGVRRRTKKVSKRKPVEEYLKHQARFRHVMHDPEAIAEIQQSVDESFEAMKADMAR